MRGSVSTDLSEMKTWYLHPRPTHHTNTIFFAFFGKFCKNFNFVIFEFFSLIFAQSLMNFYRNFANIFENVEKINPEFYEFSSKMY